MLPAPAIRAERATSDMGVLLLRRPDGTAGQGGRLDVADAAALGEGPAAPARFAVRWFDLMKPAGTVGALHCRVAVADRAAADWTTHCPHPLRLAEGGHHGGRLAGEEQPGELLWQCRVGDEDFVPVLQNAEVAEDRLPV